MGTDFIEKATVSFKKSWDRARVDLATADLFTQQPEYAARTAVAEIMDNASLEVGDKLTVEPDGDGLVARRGLAKVARFSTPSPALVKAVKDSSGVGSGTVKEVHSLAGVAEILIC